VDVLHRAIGGRAGVVLRERVKGKPGEVRLTTARWRENGFVPLTTIVGQNLEAIAMDGEGGILVRCVTPPGRSFAAQVFSGQARALGTSPRGIPGVSCAVVWERGAKQPTILAQGAVGTEEVVAFYPPQNGRPGRGRGRVAGRGTGFNWPQGQMHGPVAADLRGDGGRQHLYAAAAPEGYARLVATNLDGKEVWRHDFPDIPGTPPIWNTGGIVFWQVGRFTDRRRQDVLVTVRRSMMHSEETALLSGRDGTELWRRDRQGVGHSRGVGGTAFAIADFDGDGLDDVVSLHPSDLYIMKGATGQNILSRDTVWQGVPGSAVYWGVPIAGDFEGTGRPALYFGTGNRSLTGLIRADGSLVWWDARDRATTCLPAVGDFTGQGRIEVIGIGFDDGIRCYDAATGGVLWRMPYPASQPPVETAGADINGDGREEMLFTAGNTLYCVGSSEAGTAARGALLWKIDLPAGVGPPVIADVDGSGKASILLVGVDGYVYCVR
jgi:outer membrane protein assembly factor BamB